MENLNPSIDLSDRKNDGMTVILWWVKDSLKTYVTVDDRKTNSFTTHPVPEGVNPNRVFYHPHAYPEEVGPEPKLLGLGGPFPRSVQ